MTRPHASESIDVEVFMKEKSGRPAHWWMTLPPLVLVPGSPLHRSPAAAGSGTDESGLKAFFEQSTDPLLVLDAGHTIIEFNGAASRFFKIAPAKLRGASVLEVDLLARLLTAGSILQRLKTDQPPVVDEISVGDSEGQPLQCRIEAVPISGGRVVIHLEDSTAILRAREAVKSADRLHHAMFDALPEVAWTMALPEERLLEVSPSVERLFGYQPAAFKDHPELWEELVHPAERERVRAEFRKGLASGRPFEIHFTGMHRDHHDLPHLLNRIVPVADERGWTERCEGFISDDSSRRRLENRLRSTEASLRHVLDSVSSGVLVLAPGEKGPEVVLCNRRLADMLRLDETPRAGAMLSQVPEALRTLVRGPQSSDGDLERRLLGEETFEDIAELKDPHRVLRRYAGPVRDTYGAVIGHILSVEDVTASWLLQQRLTHAQKMESMGRLAGGVAHDFNNLLGNVLGFGSLLLEQTPEDDPRREALTQIVHSAERASRLTSALLAFSRSARFERMPVHLNRVIEDSYQLVRSALDPSVAIELRLDPSLPSLLGDALLLQQIVVNLVQEARERLSQGGSLHLTTRLFERPGVAKSESGTTETQRMVELIVDASGTLREGQPPGPAIEAQPDRAGLSLTIAEDISRAHGGFLLSGHEAAPALFRVMLPVNAFEETPAIVPEASSARGHETILVVDDEPGLRALAKTGLQQRGFDVLAASSGEEALEILRSGNPAIDIVLLDLSMPGLSGERVLRAIRGFRRDLPVIIASGYATVESQAAWNAAGAQGFVAKPYRIQDVALKLREVLDRSHGRVN
jgi:nitrogen-specific signal transduction histidine kinase/ActR/RegA family two-component response regulator